MKPIDYQTGLRKGYSLTEWAILAVCFGLIAVLLSVLAGCTIAPVATTPPRNLAWFKPGAMVYKGQPGEHGKPLARELWLSYLHFYGGQIQPANPDPNEGWVQLPDGSWWVAQAQVVEWADMNDLSEIK